MKTKYELVGAVELAQELKVGLSADSELEAVVELNSGITPSGMITVFVLDEEEYNQLQEHPDNIWYLIKG